jgi:hypothetical protein
VNKQTHKSRITLCTAAAQGRERPTTQKASAAYQIASLDTPRANLRLARGPGAAPRNLRLARELDTPSGEFLHRSRARLPLRRVPVSLEAALDPWNRTCSPDRSIKCSGMSQEPGSKANHHRVGPLTPPGNQIPALFDQPVVCIHPQRCAGVVREG